jgi:Fic family protein
MLFTPHIPLDNKGEIKKSLLKKAEDIALKDTELVPHFSQKTIEKIKNLLKITNSYYSNLIESEGTKPIDIEEALKKNYDKNDKNYKLKKLAVRYVEIQDQIKEWIKEENPFTKEFILKLHNEFYSTNLEEFLEITHKNKTFRMTPGQIRTQDVQVGKHIAPKAEDLDYLLNTFENLYRFDNQKRLLSEKIIYSISAHHRLLWIHPFPDGNGRISRLLLDAYFYYIGLKGYGIWTISRGLAIHQETYKKYLAIADMEKENSYDGRGFLSLKSLEEYVEKMLFIMEDQIDYMNNVLRLDKVLFRIEDFVDMTTSEYLKSKLPHQTIYPLASYAKQVLKELFIKGELKRSEVVELTNKSQRSVDYLMKQLKEMNLVTKQSKHSPFEVNIPYYYAEIIFPGIGKY